MFALFLSCSKQKMPLANHSRCGRGNNVSAACNTNNKSNIFCLLNVFINRHNRIWLGVISSFPDYICNVIRWIASKRDMSPSFRIRICILVGWFITIVFHSSSFSNLFRFATWQYTTLFNITYVYFIDSMRFNSIKVSVDSNELWYLPNTKHALYGCVGSYKYQYVAVLSKFFFSIQHSVLLVLNFIQKLFACSFDKCTTICFCLYYRFVASLAFVCLCPLPPPLSLSDCMSVSPPLAIHSNCLFSCLCALSFQLSQNKAFQKIFAVYGWAYIYLMLLYHSNRKLLVFDLPWMFTLLLVFLLFSYYSTELFIFQLFEALWFRDRRQFMW